MEPGPIPGDAFGEALLDALGGGEGMHVLERDDGRVETMDSAAYFSPPDAWPETPLGWADEVGGRILDVGAGAGRHSLFLQERGHRPLALDVSPGALAVCRRRGVRDTFQGTVDDLSTTDPEPFDAVIMMGNNLGLLESADRAPVLLGLLRNLVRPGSPLVGIGRDPRGTDDPDHLAYHRWNEARGRMRGQVTLRVRYRRLAGAWFDYLLPTPDELAQFAAATGWSVERIVDPDPVYLAVLRAR